MNWFCFESDFSEDFPAYGRMSANLDAEERDRWKKYLHEFIETEDHVANIKNLQARAEVARRSMDSTNSPTEGARITKAVAFETPRAPPKARRFG